RFHMVERHLIALREIAENPEVIKPFVCSGLFIRRFIYDTVHAESMVAEQADLEVRHHLVAARIRAEAYPCVIRRVRVSAGMFCHMGKLLLPREFRQVFTEVAPQIFKFRADIFYESIHPWFQALDIEHFKVFFCKMVIWHHASPFKTLLM